MAIVWQQEVEGVRYQVRTAGNSVRLYTEGVFHSQYNKRTKISGGIWDLLMIPAFFHDALDLKRILVLGVGGGAVLRMFLEHLTPDKIIGVELDPTHIKIARRFFGLKNKKIELIEQDAVSWLKSYRGPAFDLIVEDLFSESNGQPVRAVISDQSWAKLIAANLGCNGLLISNFLSRKEILASGYIKLCSNKFKSAWIFSNDRYENQIAVFSGKETSINELDRSLKQASTNNSALRKSSQNFSSSSIKIN